LYSPVKDGLKPIADRFKEQLTSTGSHLLKMTETTSNGKDLPIKQILLNSQLVEKILTMLTHH